MRFDDPEGIEDEATRAACLFEWNPHRRRSDRAPTLVLRPTRTISAWRPPSLHEAPTTQYARPPPYIEPTRRMTRGATLVARGTERGLWREALSLLGFSALLGATAGLGFCVGLVFG